jgi:hypothetical protein
MKIIQLILAITIIALTACAHITPSGVTVEGDTIYCAGKPYAKLWSIDSHLYMHDKLYSEQTTTFGLGLAIHYYNNDKEIWIHPGKGLSVYQDGNEYTGIENMQRVWNNTIQEARVYDDKGHWRWRDERPKLPALHIGGRPMEKEDLIRSGVFDVKISNDGKYVYYKAQGMLWNSSHKYLVEYGTSK